MNYHIPRLLLGACFIILFLFSANAQGWQRFYGGVTQELGVDLVQTPDGGFALLENFLDRVSIETNMQLRRVDAGGNELWLENYSIPDTSLISRSLIPTMDGGFLILGNIFEKHPILIKVNSNGTMEWSKHYLSGPDAYNIAKDLIQLPNGDIIIIAFSREGANFENKTWMIRTDALGNVIWDKVFEGLDVNIIPEQLIATADGGFAFTGQWDTNLERQKEIMLYKTDALGNLQWNRRFGGTLQERGEDLLQLADSSYIIVGRSQPIGSNSKRQIHVLRADVNGEEIWSKTFGGTVHQTGKKITQTADGNLLVVGSIEDFTDDVNELELIKLDVSGNVLWSHSFARANAVVSSNTDYLFGVTPTTDSGFAIYSTSVAYLGDTLSQQAHLMKFDSAGLVYTKMIEGYIFEDANSNCQKDSSEAPLANWIVRAEGIETNYTTTDSLGYYSFFVGTGQNIITVFSASTYWDVCQNDVLFEFTQPGYDTVQQDFAAEAIIACPDLHVDVSTPFLRYCADDNKYYVVYCNRGTLPALAAYVDLSLDPFLQFSSSSLPETDLGGNRYRFQVGDVDVGECSQFAVFIDHDCDTTVVLGQTHCVEAHIYPDSLCSPISTDWDGSSVALEGNCIGDSVTFRIHNAGLLDMSADGQYYIIVDEVIMHTGSFRLPTGEDKQVTLLAEGKTFHCMASQSEGHPGHDRPSLSIEACGSRPFSLGWVNAFPHNDGDSYLSIECQESIGPCDPNDKNAFPNGYESPHYIEKNQEIEYFIRFTNVGTDTAFNIVIVDTLSANLRPETIIPGASSHEYEWSLRGDGILTFTFNNIQLPDSTTNEPESHGFVKFRIKQQPDLAAGSMIYNSAAIYFDFNEAIITNQYYHTIGEDFVPRDLTSLNNYIPDWPLLTVAPNPFVEQTTFSLQGKNYKELDLEIYSASGQYLRHIRASNTGEVILKNQNLSPGLYFFRLLGDDQLVGIGKLMIAAK